MKVQVLIATMHQRDYSLLEKMNIQTDAIVGNQTDENSVKEFEWHGKHIKWLSFNEKGVGLNRNNALMRADGDICLFADDDMVYVDGYEKAIIRAFQHLPDADVIVFNLHEKNVTRYVNKRIRRISRLNFLRYGAARIAVRLSSVRLNGILFNQCFGGGTTYCHGEDNIFLSDCIRKGLHIYSHSFYIAKLTEERESTWNNVSKEKYLQDQGVLYAQISRRFWKILCLQDAIRHSTVYGITPLEAYKKMISKGRE